MAPMELIARIESEQSDIKQTLRDLSKSCHAIEVELASVKSRLTVLSLGGALLVSFSMWALQYLLTKG
jgi:hypothetical protein